MVFRFGPLEHSILSSCGLLGIERSVRWCSHCCCSGINLALKSSPCSIIKCLIWRARQICSTFCRCRFSILLVNGFPPLYYTSFKFLPQKKECKYWHDYCVLFVWWPNVLLQRSQLQQNMCKYPEILYKQKIYNNILQTRWFTQYFKSYLYVNKRNTTLQEHFTVRCYFLRFRT